MKRILVIEDNPRILDDIQEILSLNNFDVITAQDGASGLLLAKEHYPDLILCDVMMPELDGFEVLKTLRRNPLTTTIPVIFLTARANRDDVREGMQLGADDYLTKPFTASELLKTIATRIEKHDTIKRESAARLERVRLNIAMYLPHELLTPLNGILGMSEFLLTEYASMTTKEAIDSIQVIHNCGQRLHKLAKNFILFAKLESIAANSQPSDDNCERTAVKEIISTAAHTCAFQADREQDLELNLEEAIAKIPSKYLTKVVEEIVENAFKFSESGTPVRLVSKVDEQFFTLYISDQGRGMTNEQIANIGAYMQFDRKYYEQQGNGLGLVIAKRIVKLYGGEFSVENTISNQTSVCIKLLK